MKDQRLMALQTANAGFLLQGSFGCIGIDVFARDPDGQYPDTPARVRTMLLDACEKRLLRMLLFTHAHGDHFCAEDVLAAWQKNPDLQVIGPDAVLNACAERGMPEGSLRRISPRETRKHLLMRDLRFGESDGAPSRKETAGLSEDWLTILPTSHEGARYAAVEHDCYLLHLCGVTLAFPGDAKPDEALWEAIASVTTHIDWLFVPFPAVGVPRYRAALSASALKAEHIVACHLPRPERDAQGWISHTKETLARMAGKDRLPMPVLSETIGEWRVLSNLLR